MIKDNSGKIHYSVLLFVVVIYCLLSFVYLENKIVLRIKDKIDNALVLSSFSAAQINCYKTYETIKAEKIVSWKKVNYDFEMMYKNADVILDYSKAYEIVDEVLKKNVLLQNGSKMKDSGYNIASVIVYNVTDELEIISCEADEQNITKVYDYNESNYVYAPNGVCIRETSVYVKVEFDYTGILGGKRRFYLEKCIAVRIG